MPGRTVHTKPTWVAGPDAWGKPPPSRRERSRPIGDVPATLSVRPGDLSFAAEAITQRGLDLATSSCGAMSVGRRPRDMTRPILERYHRHLHLYRKTNGGPLSLRIQDSRLTRFEGYFAWLAAENHIVDNPAATLMLPRMERRLPATL